MSEAILKMARRFLNQSALPDEIIVDGGSKDGTWEWLLEQGNKNRKLKFFRNQHISHGRNFAINRRKARLLSQRMLVVFMMGLVQGYYCSFLNDKSVVVATALAPWLNEMIVFIYLPPLQRRQPS